MKITANCVTLSALIGSLIVGFVIWQSADTKEIFYLMPIWLFIRMALNAIDGMLAREFNQKSDLGAYLNELCDVVSDTVLYMVFIYAADMYLVITIVILSIISEYAGVMAPLVKAKRRYDGPMGKSDRAFVFGVLGVMVGSGIFLNIIDYILWIVLLLLVYTIFNRVKEGLKEAKNGQ
ncbi:MAG: CDP-alcohol phosphatidyltransferase family protein [Campylobacteraceae bacterium]|jgi:CDP-diacylglycerol--glycerol-3-phosphate 3-phosphatidyltransferase|nr:CDP-alcohol phosphatidyltransferase family protein [Campylobacteraceae bacterium]